MPDRWFQSPEWVEILSARLHEIYQLEAHCRGDVRHADAYEDLPDETKEWDRVLARWIVHNWEPRFNPYEGPPPALMPTTEPRDADPDPRDLVRELRRAVGLFDGALPYSPKRAWEEAIAEVKRLRHIDGPNVASGG